MQLIYASTTIYNNIPVVIYIYTMLYILCRKIYNYTYRDNIYASTSMADLWPFYIGCDIKRIYVYIG